MQKIIEQFSSAGMDHLFQIIQTGNVEELQQLLAQNPLLLHNVSLTCSENPLHYSSAAGHLEFCREMLKQKPGFARELNPEGYSPMHLASANGHVEIVREIIGIDSKLCRLHGRDKKTPLHLAAIKGRVDILCKMLADCEGCIEDVTMQNETALHLAVKNCQFNCLRVMVDWIREMNKEDILNRKDELGNTILHVAAWKKQRQVLDLLLSKGSGKLDVNAKNKSGLTALDLLRIFPSEAGDREIQDILKGAGALKAQDIDLHITTDFASAREHTSDNPSRDLVEYFKFKEGRDSPSDVRTTLLVLAVLVATATYQVGINPPGGLWQDDDQGHVAGTSIMGDHNIVAYIILVAFNSIGFSLSIYLIGTLTRKFPLQAELQVCLIALYFTYNVSLINLSSNSVRVFPTVFTSVFPTAVPLAGRLLRKYRVGERVLHLFRRRR